MAHYKLQSPIGVIGEKLALRYLEGKGYRILDTNYYPAQGKRAGEIDIVAQKGDTICFIEVKTRQISDAPGDIIPEEQVTRSKLLKLQRAASRYLREKGLDEAAYGFHVVTVCYNPKSQHAQIRHLEDVFF